MTEPSDKPPILPAGPPPPSRQAATGSRPPLLPPKLTAYFQRGTSLSVEPLLNPEELERFKNLLVFARSTVEGYFAGKHRSPYRGSSVEFADYKEYVPGDELRKVDWRIYGRSRRLYVRQFEEETDMVVYLLVDVSASMGYRGQDRLSKYRLAAKVAAALAYLMIHQGDQASLALFADKVTQFVPPGGTRRHLQTLVRELDRVRPASTTGMAAALFDCHQLFRKRGRLVILSDFLTDQKEFFEALGQFLHRRFDVLLLQVVDPDELTLPPMNAARFEDLETREQVDVEPEEIRAAYRQVMRESIDRLALQANEHQVSHALVNTRDPYLDALEAYLGFRGVNTLSTGSA